MSYVVPIKDTVAIGELRKSFSQAKYLFNKYKEFNAAKNAQAYLDFLITQRELDTLSTIKNLETLSDLLATMLGIRHGFMDKIDDREPWDSTIKKKLEFPDMTDEERSYRAKLDREWKQLAFDVTYYIVKCKGDAHILLAGPNLSGKSNTAIPFLMMCNKILREFWKVDRYNEFYVEKHPEVKGVKLRKFNIKKDVSVTPNSQELKDRFKNEQYQTIDVNEGMEAATNLQSMKAENIALAIRRFTTRSYHNIVVWEYQVQDRPTAMMLEGMNFWFQKMRKRHFILSIASTLVRKKDPYYLKELSKCRTDKEIGTWMTNKTKNGNPNFVHVFRSPKMGPKLESRFQMWYWESKDKQAEGEKTRRSFTQDYDNMVADIWRRVNLEHTLSFIEIGDMLDKAGFQKKDKESFMRDYGKYNRNKLWEGYKMKELKEVEAMKNGG